MMNKDLNIEYISTDVLKPYVNNSRTHSDEQIDQICESIEEFGFTNPILIGENNGIIAGHGRLLAAIKLNLYTVPTIRLTGLSDIQKKAYVIADNSLALNAGWNFELLSLELNELKDLGFDTDLLGFDDDFLKSLDGDLLADISGDSNSKEKLDLKQAFLAPPFSILNSREGWWQDRKRKWKALGIDSGSGRDSGMQRGMNSMARYNSKEDTSMSESDDSIFDPVLCEILYSWFSPKGCQILDPFAGGSVRGIVASKLNRNYIGVDLRAEQIEANLKQRNLVCSNDELQPIWICGDSINIDKLANGVSADLVFSCPPYADLEVYSNNPNDLSNMDYDNFKKAYFEIIKKSCDMLKDNRFACFVVGEVRDKKGNYYNFVGDTIQAFLEAGLSYYNEMILVNVCGTMPMRAATPFKGSRKIGKVHQNVLVFVKGNPKIAAEYCGDVDVYIPNEDN